MKNFILKTLGYINGFIFMFSVSCLDSEPNTIFVIASIISLSYLSLFYYANKDLIERGIENE